ncbi:MAG TPA: hypothetical protein VKV04_23430 [Verrucomicrobiae bacterium]|nr:hypothetical protein [Verrucomicrobiae bacterium]
MAIAEICSWVRVEFTTAATGGKWKWRLRKNFQTAGCFVEKIYLEQGTKKLYGDSSPAPQSGLRDFSIA